ncbi:hypothetical protein EUA06_16605 [Nocardioides glacieisoli]|uniref:ABM domain-containing protein n=1 Tax=Nocardioides glacieisoli TaxID=1168730 RepID=A0A4Q2RK54_9ACTN|nr:hypothetical protein [Nocardioides glacieisoli]RYB89110.1 hypothetical protein EUA06_16605 [Nocardioides glacieisoli]
MSLYFTATVDVPLPGEPDDLVDLQHAMYDAALASHGGNDPSLGAYTHFEDGYLQVTFVVEADDEVEALHKSRSLVTGVLSDHGELPPEPSGSVELADGRDTFDAITEALGE